MNLSNWDTWVDFMRYSIAAATIARLAQDQIAAGKGAPGVEDMRRFCEEGEAVAELWQESLSSAEQAIIKEIEDA